MSEKLYVLGFAFDTKGKHVALVHKDRPDWQKGLVNGIGGKIELEDPTYAAAMAREFREETGVWTLDSDWKHFATLHFGQDKLGGEAMVFCYSIFTDDIWQCKTQETEKVEIFAIPPGGMGETFSTDTGLTLVPHVHVLIPMARDKGFLFGEFKMQ